MREPELTCNSCKKRTAMSTMKYSKDGAGLICGACLDKQNNGVALTSRAPVATPMPDEDTRKKVSFSCRNCGYRYARVLDFRGPKLCPNCGRDTVSYNLPNKADQLLRELEDL